MRRLAKQLGLPAHVVIGSLDRRARDFERWSQRAVLDEGSPGEEESDGGAFEEEESSGEEFEESDEEQQEQQ